ncbi:MAG: sulfite exporter TauE/SafE family protein, partial [Campylobacteraceae bacterium]|nr:sulfite exporter TauE/SafE family protein [Campylobacteraceae bacterium]
MLELIIFGVLTGFVSGYFGVGGGMVLVPMLLYYGVDMKQAVSISITQMVFSSVYGSFLNIKKTVTVIKDGLILGIGGFIGGLQSGFIVSNVTTKSLEYLF